MAKGKPLSEKKKAQYAKRAKKRSASCKNSTFFDSKTGRPKRFLKMGGGISYRLHVPGYNFSGKMRKPNRNPPSAAQLAHRKAFGQAQTRRNAGAGGPKGKGAFAKRDAWLANMGSASSSMPVDNFGATNLNFANIPSTTTSVSTGISSSGRYAKKGTATKAHTKGPNLNAGKNTEKPLKVRLAKMKKAASSGI